MRRADLSDLVRRYRRLQRRKRERLQSQLDWRRPGTVWAADFKERREPIEGRYGWILSIKDLASRYQLAWQPVAEATAEVVQATYARLFQEHGPPLVLKSDNGSQFKADETKQLLAAHRVVGLFSPRRHPQYNGGVERANGQLSGYQESLAEFHGRPRAPTCDDAQGARALANELARPSGWRGPTAAALWSQRTLLDGAQRASFLASVEQGRARVRAQWDLAPEIVLTHEQASAVDRRAVRDALMTHDLLRIRPRRRPQATHADETIRAMSPQHGGAGILELTTLMTSPVVGEEQTQSEEVHSSTNKSSASGKH
jgi:transposase InsO family protein